MRGEKSVSSSSTVSWRFGIFFSQRRDGPVPAYRGEVSEELGQRLAFLKVVDQGLERNSRADKDGCPLEDFGVAVNCARMFHGPSPRQILAWSYLSTSGYRRLHGS